MIAVSQRVDRVPGRDERRDALDQRWALFFQAVGIQPLLIPNQPALASVLIEALRPEGLIMTGGNDLSSYGGDAPERDATELLLLRDSIAEQRPIIGVCRGMQLIQEYYGSSLREFGGHVCPEMTIEVDGRRRRVNSYHRWGSRHCAPPLEVFAVADDGVVKGVWHQRLPIIGIMWHPERYASFDANDIDLFRRHLGVC